MKAVKFVMAILIMGILVSCSTSHHARFDKNRMSYGKVKLVEMEAHPIIPATTDNPTPVLEGIGNVASSKEVRLEDDAVVHVQEDKEPESMGNKFFPEQISPKKIEEKQGTIGKAYTSEHGISNLTSILHFAYFLALILAIFFMNSVFLLAFVILLILATVFAAIGRIRHKHDRESTLYKRYTALLKLDIIMILLSILALLIFSALVYAVIFIMTW